MQRRIHDAPNPGETTVKLLIVCLLAIVGSIIGIMLCDGMAKHIFQFSAFISLAVSFVFLVIGQFN